MPKNFQTPRIVQPSHREHRLLWVLAGVLITLVSWKVFDWGRQQAGFDTEACSTEIDLLEQRMERIREERDSLREQSARYERASQIDQSAVSAVRGDLKSLQEQRSRLSQEVELLKSMVSGQVSLIQVTDFSLVPTEQGYAFSFTLSKRAKDKERVTGSVFVTVAGQLAGEDKILRGSELGTSNSYRIGFMHFQNFEGEITLPEGFEPEKFHVEVKTQGKTYKPVQQEFDWSAG